MRRIPSRKARPSRIRQGTRVVRPGARVATAVAAGLATGSLVLVTSVPALAAAPDRADSSPPSVPPLVEPPAAPSGPVPPLVQPPYPPVTSVLPPSSHATPTASASSAAPVAPPAPQSSEPPSTGSPVPPLVQPPAEPPQERACDSRVAAGDTLWDLADRLLGDGGRWRELYEANRAAIEAAARAHGLAASDGGQLVFPDVRLRIPGACT